VELEGKAKLKAPQAGTRGTVIAKKQAEVDLSPCYLRRRPTRRGIPSLREGPCRTVHVHVHVHVDKVRLGRIGKTVDVYRK